jgi:hypothetical protein
MPSRIEDYALLDGCETVALLARSTGTGGWLRRYRGDTLILETDIETPKGAVRLIEFMPPRTNNSDLVRLPCWSRHHRNASRARSRNTPGSDDGRRHRRNN